MVFVVLKHTVVKDDHHWREFYLQHPRDGVCQRCFYHAPLRVKECLNLMCHHD